MFLSTLSGGQAYGAEVLLDGASIQRSENGSSFDETSPSIEALQEFKVTTSTPSAEFGRTTSGIESFSTKSGTNDFHGTAFALIKNRVFDANNWFNNGYTAQQCQGVSEINCAYSKPQDSKFDYGGVFGGPVWIPHVYNGHDRTFFLFAWEKYQFNHGGVITSTVPTAAERGGDFSDILGSPSPGRFDVQAADRPMYWSIRAPETRCCTTRSSIRRTTRQISPGVFCRTPFTNNQIPTSLLSPTAQKLVSRAAPAQSGSAEHGRLRLHRQLRLSGRRPDLQHHVHHPHRPELSAPEQIFGSYNTRQNFHLTGQPDFPVPFNNSGYPQTFTTHYGRAGWDYTLTPTLLNHLNLGYNRTNSAERGLIIRYRSYSVIVRLR